MGQYRGMGMHSQTVTRFQTFLAEAGWGGARIEPIAGDASFRRYFRIVDGDRRAMLMDAPPPEDPEPFLMMARYLGENGLRAPAVLAGNAADGLVLLEDFGDCRMREAVDGPQAENEAAIYRCAVDTLIALQSAPLAPVASYGPSEYQREADLFVEWYCPARGLAVDTSAYRTAWETALQPLYRQGEPQVTVLRDYHAENIMLLDSGEQGLLDFQDALIGSPAYDLVSLLQDARRDVSTALEAEMLAYFASRNRLDFDLDTHYRLLGAQRNAKIIGIFVRLWVRDGKPRYPTLIPRVWDALERDLASPALAPVAQWFDANIPAALRDPTGVLGGAFAL